MGSEHADIAPASLGWTDLDVLDRRCGDINKRYLAWVEKTYPMTGRTHKQTFRTLPSLPNFGRWFIFARKAAAVLKNKITPTFARSFPLSYVGHSFIWLDVNSLRFLYGTHGRQTAMAVVE